MNEIKIYLTNGACFVGQPSEWKLVHGEETIEVVCGVTGSMLSVKYDDIVDYEWVEE